MGNTSLLETIGSLEIMFSTFNQQFFKGELQKPIITVSPDTTRGAYGWCTSWKAWKESADHDGFYEINICAEHLNRDFFETCDTMIHEMVHLLNLQDGVKDTSRSGMYHNKKFKEVAEQHGLIVEKSSKYGWSTTKLSEETANWIRSIWNDQKAFGLFRAEIPKFAGKKASSSKKYVCPHCGVIVRATKTVRIKCSDCEIEMLES